MNAFHPALIIGIIIIFRLLPSLIKQTVNIASDRNGIKRLAPAPEPNQTCKAPSSDFNVVLGAPSAEGVAAILPRVLSNIMEISPEILQEDSGVLLKAC